MACADCGLDKHYYMLLYSVWHKAIANQFARFLCLDCVENRLGRQLTQTDFSTAPVNATLKFGYLMGRRDKASSGEQP